MTQRDLSIESDLDSNLPTVWNDRDILLQVMTDLLGNSLKFTPNGGKVSIKARKLDPNESNSSGEMFEVSVTDTGSEIRPS
ncbi:MAG TPA: hypothetical protein EYQ67_10620 [Dehalococcoidia bacterium]|nr:hypothetical protein [Dehalococcoidia bacterium]HIM04015.1 hypothetical protein [Gammaproteobacteria bacterium]